MPWRKAADEAQTEVRNAVYDAFSQGVRLRVAGYSAERIRSEGLRSLLALPPEVGAQEHLKLVE